MKFLQGLAALCSFATVSAQACNADNCLRAMRSPERIAEARAFCGTYATTTASIPAFATSACTGDTASRVSSACACIATTASATSTAAPTAPSCGPDATYPAIPLPSGAFDLVGYAKENPIGPVSGGAGGPTTTISAGSTAANSALIAAVTGANPLTIIIEGEFALPARLRVNGANKSIIGGKNGTIARNGMTLINATNIIVQNLRFTGVLDNDCMTIQNTTRVWVDHNDLSSNPNIIKNGPDLYDGLMDVIRASDWITVSWNYFHDHYKASLVGNNDQFRAIDFGHLHLTYHHNYWRNLGTRGNAGRFGHQHLYNNYYKDFRYQAIHSRSDNQVLVEGNVFTGDTREALSTYGLVIPEDSPNTSPLGDFEIDGYANLGAENDFGGSGVNITQVGNFTTAPYSYKLTPLADLPALVVRYSGLGKL
ncbi:hypothetical protein ONS96_014141 [Cadophora gregata f. sp. sojae]|nr:hypothetical protein ONS96_014141 [Cadophora gregata f. sp. sojae]